MMLQNPAAKYRAFPPVQLSDRQWPNNIISKPPIWMSTDLRDGNQALIEPMSAEKKLRDKLAFQNALIDAMPDPMFVRDLQGRLVMCNKSYEDVLSTRFDLIQGRQLTEVDVMPRHTAELLHSELMAQLAARRARFCERQLMFKDGMRNIYQWSVPFYSADGQLRGLLGGWADIGQRSRQS